MKRILIVEDDKTIRDELTAVLSSNGYDVMQVTDFIRTPEIVREQEPHLVLLDINLPGQDGYKLCTQIRSFSSIPIIFVTSRDGDMDELNGMMIGGDDFITKPYNISILLARISVILKRAYTDEVQESITHKNVSLHIDSGKIEHDGRIIELTKNEQKILAYLFRHKNKIVSRIDLVEYLWDNQMYVDDNALSVHITRLRNKLEQINVHDFIKTKHGQGYMI